MPSNRLQSNDALPERVEFLVGLLTEIQHRRQARNESSLTNIREFALRLADLAKEYECRANRTKISDLARQRHFAVHKAAQSLAAAMAELEHSERELLLEKQQKAFHSTRSVVIHEDENYSQSYLEARSIYGQSQHLFIEESLRSLTEAAGCLTKRRTRGRQVKSDEQWLAKEFVVACHQFGWCPIRFSDRPYIGRDADSDDEAPPFRFDAMGCLAATMAAAGVSAEAANSMALTALRTLRKQPFEYWDSWGGEEALNTYSLVEIIRHDESGHKIEDEFVGLRELPRFSPDSQR